MPEPKPSIDSVAVLLQTIGADVTEATRVTAMWVKEEKRSPTFVEVYGRGSIVQEAARSRRDLGVAGRGAFDLRTAEPNGEAWDFSRRADRALASDYLLMEKPMWVIGSPPCTPRCSLNQNLDYPEMDPARVQQLMAGARTHLEFVCRL